MRACAREKPVQAGDNESGSLLAAEVVGGKQRNHRSDDDRRNPIAEALIIRTRLIHHFNYTEDIDAAGIYNLAQLGFRLGGRSNDRPWRNRRFLRSGEGGTENLASGINRLPIRIGYGGL